jgi:hypothetical protein
MLLKTLGAKEFGANRFFERRNGNKCRRVLT